MSHGKGEGPGGYKLFGDGKLAFWRQMTQETLGGAGVSEANGVPQGIADLLRPELAVESGGGLQIERLR